MRANYFVIRDMTDSLTLSHGGLQKCRTLESRDWTRYVLQDTGARPVLRHALIFYWKKDNTSGPIRDFNALASFRKRKTGLLTIFKSVMWATLIGVVAGLITWVLTPLITPSPLRCETCQPMSLKNGSLSGVVNGSATHTPPEAVTAPHAPR